MTQIKYFDLKKFSVGKYKLRNRFSRLFETRSKRSAFILMIFLRLALPTMLQPVVHPNILIEYTYRLES